MVSGKALSRLVLTHARLENCCLTLLQKQAIVMLYNSRQKNARSTGKHAITEEKIKLTTVALGQRPSFAMTKMLCCVSLPVL